VYNEFVVRTSHPAKEILADLEHEKILGGIPIDTNDFLVAVTGHPATHAIADDLAARRLVDDPGPD